MPRDSRTYTPRYTIPLTALLRRPAPASESPSGSARSICSTAYSRYSYMHMPCACSAHGSELSMVGVACGANLRCLPCVQALVLTLNSGSAHGIAYAGSQQRGRGSARGQPNTNARLRRTSSRARLHDRRNVHHYEGARTCCMYYDTCTCSLHTTCMHHQHQARPTFCPRDGKAAL